MKLDKTQIAVFIENEAQLQRARELLERHGGEVDNELFKLSSTPYDKYLIFSESDNNWWICSVSQMMVEYEFYITLSELEEILKGEKGE